MQTETMTQNQQKVVVEQLLASDFEQATMLLAEKLDFLDVQILRKFYMTGKDFPFDTQPFCFPILYREMKDGHRLKICQEAFRKRLDNLTSTGFLGKLRGSNPVNYEPVRDKDKMVRAVITKFFLIHGLTKFV
ncbi:MAG: hypothetical protein NT016_01225 [Candidatus Aenigmarchaeota archaeon]|nr:hypothetical protein [Candidatus Aenigmarchaeota archaeon]